MARWTVAGVVLAVLLSSVSLCSGAVYLRDHSATSLAHTVFSQQLTAEGLAATLQTLMGSGVLTIDADAATQVSALLPDGLLRRPEAVLAVHVVGADTELAQLEGWAKHGVAPCCDSNRVAQHFALAAAATPSVQYGEQCVEEGLQYLASLLGGVYTPGSEPLAGRLSLPAPEGGGTLELELGAGGEEERVWAVELAAALKGVEAGGSAKVYGWTLVGLQAMQLKHGATSPQFRAAQAAMLAVVASMDAALAAHHGNSLVSVVVLSAPVDLPEPTLPALLRWKAMLEEQRSSVRRLQENPYAYPYPAAPLTADNSTEESVYDMTTRVSAWVVGLMLLVTLGGAVWCMSYMEFKRDPLLFGVPKTRAD